MPSLWGLIWPWDPAHQPPGNACEEMTRKMNYQIQEGRAMSALLLKYKTYHRA